MERAIWKFENQNQSLRTKYTSKKQVEKQTNTYKTSKTKKTKKYLINETVIIGPIT